MKLFLLVVLCGAGLVSGTERSACMDESGIDLREKVEGFLETGKGFAAFRIANFLNMKKCGASVLTKLYEYFMDGNEDCIDISLDAFCMGSKALHVMNVTNYNPDFGNLDEVIRSSGDLTHILCQKGELCFSELKSRYDMFMELKKRNELKACYNAIKNNRAEILKDVESWLDDATMVDGPKGTMARIAKGVLEKYDINSENIMEKFESFDFEEIKEKALSTITKFCDNGCYDDGTVFLREYFELIGDCKPAKFCECDTKDKISTLEYPCCIQSIIDENPEAVDKLKELESVIMEVAEDKVSGDGEKILKEVTRQKECYDTTYDKRNIDHCYEA